ncbi:hypothetical protein FBUS_01715 [Fasciolopsis buskii]|uniref:C2H2-type domain-containing protein n=1 Tax=Fasciolopsis buskii TaxID=27845 RepID=A0A8E0VNG2_9TREM|nr:hypothetical protein FBUS_01715 [Fasciolopsis buski]
MELPSFDILWQSSEKLLELESLLEEIDQHEVQKEFASTKRTRFFHPGAGLYGARFAIEDQSYYEPVRNCCDQAFYTDAAYALHVSGHIPCSVAGCSFVAHPNALRLHKELVHSSEYFDKVFRSSADSSVAQWREARKRNYPTIERAAVHQEILAERLARGQVFKTQEFGAITRQRAPLLNAKKLDRSVVQPTPSVSDDPSPVQHTTCPGSTNVELPEKSSQSADSSVPRLVSCEYDSDTDASEARGSSSSTDEDKSDGDHDLKSPSSPGLLDPVDPLLPEDKGNPQSTGDSVTHLGDEETSKATPSNDTQSVAQRRRRRRRGGRRRQRDQLAQDPITGPIGVIDAASVNPSNPFASHPIVQLRAKRRACVKHPERIHSRPTLLHMLLAEEMRTERNQLMQCVRYVVKNNFFLDSSSVPKAVNP